MTSSAAEVKSVQGSEILKITGVPKKYEVRYQRFQETLPKFLKYRGMEVRSGLNIDYSQGTLSMQTIPLTVVKDRFGESLKNPVKGAMVIPNYSFIDNPSSSLQDIARPYKSSIKQLSNILDKNAPAHIIVIVYQRDAKLFDKIAADYVGTFEWLGERSIEFIPFAQLLSVPMEHSHSGNARILNPKATTDNAVSFSDASSYASIAKTLRTPYESFNKMIKGRNTCDPVVTWLGAEVGDIVYMQMNITDPSISGSLVNVYYVDDQKNVSKIKVAK